MAACDSGSASRKAPSVSSENTTPQPNVASGALRSRIVTSCPGSAFFIRSPKYSPAGPPPTTTILMPRSSCQDLGQAIGLGEVRHGREEDQFVAARFLVPPHELADRADVHNLCLLGCDVESDSRVRARRALHDRSGVSDADQIP